MTPLDLVAPPAPDADADPKAAMDASAASDASSAVPDAPGLVGFAALGLHPDLLAALDVLGYEEPTPIQREAIPPALAGRDLLGQAATGTGKTAAFALPILQGVPFDATSGVTPAPGRTPRALVLVPTRELAMQVAQAFDHYGRQRPVRTLPVYGGQPIGRQIDGLRRGVDVVVATPGRAVDHLRRGTLDLDGLDVVVLDEADEMLDMGFAEDLETILGAAPEHRQTLLFSATMPPRIAALARRYLHDPIRLRPSGDARVAGEVPRILQRAYVVPRGHKPAALGRVLDIEAPEATLVFCGTRDGVDELTETMNGRGYRAEALHGGLSQEQRDRVMERLRAGTADLLVATDVAARGLDVDHLTHVVNYDLPTAPEAYTHRIGRVGRAGREGVAITLVEPRQQRLLETIERHTGGRIDLAPLPTVAELRTRRRERTAARVREALLDADRTTSFATVLDELTGEFDLRDVALAAIALAHDATAGRDDVEELPQVALSRPERPERPARRAPSGGGASRPAGGGSRPDGATRIWIGLGRDAGIRPKDLVGAIAGESSVAGREVGAIEITQRYSLVDVPAARADEVVQALRSTTIKGRRASVRPDRVGQPRRPRSQR